mgnify:CR=1 FL=1
MDIAILPSGIGVDAVVKELAKSDRSWCVNFTYGPASLRASGTGIRAGSVKCNADGLAVETLPRP